MSCIPARGLAALALLFPALASAQFVSITSAGAGEDFNTLASSGTTGNTLPDGWYIAEANQNADGAYRIGDGSSNTGDTWSYGTTGSTERALGLLQSGNLIPTVGAQLRNDTGGILTELPISYIGEQWRLGNTARADGLTFEYSTNATSLTTGTWTAVAALGFTAPVQAGTVGALNGNLPANSTLVEGAIGGLSLAPGASLWIRWTDINASGADDGLAIDDVVFGTAEDVAPTLAASVPANGATNFPADGALSLSFSEAVTVSGNWFSISCPTSGNRSVADTVVGGGPTAYSINPNVDFAIGETCTLNLVPANIVDNDGTPDAYTGPTAITFTTVAPPPNTPPSVTGTVPSQGAQNFPPAGDLGATFSEPVTLSAGAFALSCATSGNITLVHATSGSAFSIDTGTSLVAGEACTFTIDADGVSDAQGAHPTADTVINFLVSDSSTSTYYAQVNTSTPAQLRCSLHETIDNHTAFPYTSSSTDTWDILNLADEDPVNTGAILDIYRNETMTKITGGQGAYNREHTWPNSLGFPGGQPGAYTDTHMLYASHTGYNSTRGNKRYDNCPGCSTNETLLNHGVGGPGHPNRYNNSVYEVWSGRKGDAARAMFYMAIRYEGDNGEPQLELTNNASLIQGMTSTGPGNPAYMGILSTLIAWHQADPPDARELERNEIVFSFQGNRNPFIDHPEWASEALFTSTRPTTCELGGGTNLPPVANDDTYNATEDTALVVNAPGVLGNDSDPEGATLTAVLVGNVSHGSLVLAASGAFTYTPATDYCGSDAFTYRANDGTQNSAVANVAINIACVNDAPVVTPATFSLPENSAVGTVVGTVAATDVESNTLTFAITSGNTGGAFAINAASGQITVANAAALDFETTPQFSVVVTVTDNGLPPMSGAATITINLTDVNENPENQPPVAVGSIADIDAVEGEAIAVVDVSTAFEDADGDTLTYMATNLPTGLSLDPATGLLSGTPAAGTAADSPYTVNVYAFDGEASASQTFELRVTEAGTPPLAIFADGFED